MFGTPGGRAGSENDTLLPLTMTHDQFCPPWKHWHRKEKYINSDKTIRHSQWGMPNYSVNIVYPTCTIPSEH